MLGSYHLQTSTHQQDLRVVGAISQQLRHENADGERDFKDRRRRRGMNSGGVVELMMPLGLI